MNRKTPALFIQCYTIALSFLRFVMAYQLIDLQTHEGNFQCPHCQQAVLDWEQEHYIQPCEHSLFMAMDLGFEYISDEFEATMQRTVDDIHADDENANVFHEITQSNYPNFVIYKFELGVQDLYRYMGFVAQ